MNGQITILDRNNQSINVDLICYFGTNNKKYIFYNKNETVQDGLIKMYVAEENMGLNSDISQDEWNNLKKIMQGIITGNIGNIEFLTYNSPVIFNESKAIALNDSNINAIKNAYKNATTNSVETVLNKDILTQNFGGNSTIETSTEPVQISPIPSVQNTFNMESTPVNLNLESSVSNNDLSLDTKRAVSDTGIPNLEVSSIEPTIPESDNSLTVPNLEVSSIEPIMSPVETNIQETQPNENNIALNINSIKPGGIDSSFNISSEPNIFDNPLNITEEEINKVDNPEVSMPKVVSNNTNINNKKIDLNNRKIKIFEELANIYREENELLSNNDDINEVLENTASNLFDNNGILNDSVIN